MRAAFYIDGFNLYHAIDVLRQPHLKWVSLWDAANLLLPCRSQRLTSVVYFSAFSTHRPDRLVRHRQYVSALTATGVETIMGNFKMNRVQCRRCGNTWQKPEERETDVNLAIRLVHDAYRDAFDIAYVLSGDSDLVRCAPDPGWFSPKEAGERTAPGQGTQPGDPQSYPRQ